MKKLKAKKAIFTENVGIGEENPTNGLLHLRQSTNDAIRLQRSGSGVNDGNVYFGHSGGGLGISTSGAIGVTNPDFFISSSGNVGIGTTNPGVQLNIKNQSTTSNKVQIGFTSQDGTQNAAITHTDEAGEERLALSCGGFNFEHFVLDNSGNVGIGTTNPSKPLHIAANAHHIALEDTNGTVGSKMVGIYNNNQQLHLGRYSDDNFNDFTTDLFINSTGNVGIGTTNPGDAVHVNGGMLILNDVTAATTTLRVARPQSGHSKILFSYRTDASGAEIFNDGNTGNLSIQNANGNLVLSNGGNVGIGTTNPSAKLEVDYVAASQIGLTLNGSNTALNNAIKLTDASDNEIILSINAGNFAINGGNVGIGTTNPSASLHIKANDDSTNALALWVVNKAHNNSIISAYENGDVSIGGFKYEDSTGNVGIGTNSPTADLHINSKTTATAADYSVSSLRFQNGSSFNNSILINARTDMTGATDYTDKVGLIIATKGSERVRIDSSGNVGIGTPNPQNKLTVQSDSISNTLTEAVSIIGGNYTNSTNAESFKFFHQTQTSNTNRGVAFKSIDGLLTIQTIVTSDNSSFANNISLQPNAGNVGIGTTSPTHKLHVADATTMKIGGADDGTFNDLTNHSSRVGGSRYNNTHRPVHMMMHTSTSSESNLFLGWGTGSMDCPTKITFGTAANITTASNNSANKRMMIHSSGNVSIGADVDTHKFYVSGSTYTTTSWGASDDRLKHNEQTITGAIETLKKITPKKYFKTTELYEANHDFDLDSDGNPIDENGKKVEHFVEAGVIAQEVLSVDELAFAVNEGSVDEDGKETPHGLNYNSLFTYAIAAIQEQQAMIEDLKKEIEQLKS